MVQSFTINTRIQPDFYNIPNRSVSGYEYWIGQMIPNDVMVGRQLLESLYKQAGKQGKLQDDVLKIGAIHGVRGILSAEDRRDGLMAGLNDHQDVVLMGSESGQSWSKQSGIDLASRLLERFPELEAIWVANDSMAMGAIEEIKRRNLIPGEDIILAGVDWLPEAFPFIRSGELVCSFGGHFIDGAAALAVAYDYMNGIGQGNVEALNILTEMETLNADNIAQNAPIIEQMDWDAFDFRIWTKTHNPDLKTYQYSIKSLL